MTSMNQIYDRRDRQRRKKQLAAAVGRTAKIAKKAAERGARALSEREAARTMEDGDAAAEMEKDPDVDNDEQEIRMLRKIQRNQRIMLKYLQDDRRRDLSQQADPEFGAGAGGGMAAQGDADFDWTSHL